MRKKIGYVSMDRSGDEANLPYVVVSTFSRNRADFTKIYEGIKKLCISYNPILGYTREIKAKEIKSTKLMEDIIDLCLSEGLKFFASLFNGSIKRIGKGHWKGKLKVESMIWFKSLEFLIDKENIRPEHILMDISFTKTKDQSLFDFFIQNMIINKFKFKPFVKSLDSRFEDGIKIADLIAGFLRKSKIVRNLYRDRIKTVSVDRLKKNSFLWASVSHGYPQVKNK